MHVRPLAILLGVGCALLGLILPAPARENPRQDDEWIVDTWLGTEGLPESSAMAMVEDDEGFRWLATPGGLMRFDGHQFRLERFSLDHGGVPRHLTQVWRDRQNRLWLSDELDVHVRERGEWRVWPGSRLLEDRRESGHAIRSFVETRGGRVFFSTFGGQVVTASPSTPVTLPDPPQPEAGPVTLALDGTDTLYAVTRTGLLRWDGSQWLALVRPEGPSTPALGPKRDGGIWFLDGDRLSGWQGTTESIRRSLSQLVVDPWSLHELRNGEVWVTSGDEGLYRLRPDGRVTRYGPENLLLNPGTRFVVEDDDGTLWVGTKSGGLSRWRRRPVYAVGTQQGLPLGEVKSVAIATDGQVLAGTWGGGARLGPASIGTTLKPVPFPWPAAPIFSVLRDRANRSWVGLSGGAVWREEGGTFRSVWGEDRQVGRDVRVLFEDSRGIVWAGGPRGLAAIRPDGAFTALPLELDSSVVALGEERSGSLWVASARTVFVGGTNGFRPDNVLARAGVDAVAALRGDPAGGLWVGSIGEGLAYLRDGRVTLIRQPGFAPESVWGLEFDLRTNLWLSTPQGIFRLDRPSVLAVLDQPDRRMVWRRFDAADGLTSGECTSYGQPTIARSPAGELWFATSRGLAVIDPARFEHLPPPPRLALDAVVYESTERGSPRPVTHTLTVPPGEAVTLPAGSRRVEFHFAVLSYGQAERVRTEVQLEGVDRDWIDNSGWRFTHYTDPRPGHYRFRARACNADGVWNETGIEVPVVVQAYYWQQAWFQWGGLVAAGASAAGLTLQWNRRRWARNLALTRAHAALLSLAQSRAFREGDRAAALARLAESAAALLEVAQASVWFLDEARETLHCADLFDRGQNAHTVAPPLRAREYPAYFRAIEHERFIDAEDAREDPRTREFTREYLAPQGITSMLDAPVRAGGRVIGVLCLEHIGPRRRWTPQDEFLAAAHADLVALAVENAGRHQAETALRELNASLERRVDERTMELAATNAKLQELDRLKSEFLAMMSHELRTPLNSIVGFTGILKAGMAGPVNIEQKKQLELVNRAAKHLLSLINDILDLSRIEAGRMEVHLEPVVVAAVLDEVERTLAPQVAAKNLVYRNERTDPDLTLVTDRRKFYQIVLNLAANAVKFTEQGEVVVSVAVQPDRVEFAVRDTGPGIRPEQMGCLFEAFRQVDGSARRNREGAGLGLYLCQKLTGLLRGGLEAQSEFGRGSVFRFWLPMS